MTTASLVRLAGVPLLALAVAACPPPDAPAPPPAPSEVSAEPATPPAPAATNVVASPSEPAVDEDSRMAPPGSLPPRPPPPAGPPPVWGDAAMRACETAADCVISCAGDCCGAPCGCGTAVNKTWLARWNAGGGRRCDPLPDCPAMGCAREDFAVSGCVEGRCRTRKASGTGGF